MTKWSRICSYSDVEWWCLRCVFHISNSSYCHA